MVGIISVKGQSQLLMAEDRFEVLRIYSGVVVTSLFKVHIPSVG